MCFDRVPRANPEAEPVDLSLDPANRQVLVSGRRSVGAKLFRNHVEWRGGEREQNSPSKRLLAPQAFDLFRFMIMFAPRSMELTAGS